ncbi:MAG: MotA/TolQ/ExbB proton channel family protein [Lentisphaeria bacterium]|nr:MAG: MotA/TolQ/ExbB proton channel family protein [Lentisphaeria bacterium]
MLIGSVFTWTVMIDKAMALYRARKLSQRFIARFRSNKRNIATPALVREGQLDASPVGIIYSAGVGKLLEFYESDALNQQFSAGINTRPVKLSDAQYNAIEAVLEREVSGQIQELETRIGLLATLVSVSPFCGLFGTVWGVMLAFCGIAAAGKSDFTALAPGVAGALLTTVAGLIVAIPPWSATTCSPRQSATSPSPWTTSPRSSWCGSSSNSSPSTGTRRQPTRRRLRRFRHRRL